MTDYAQLDFWLTIAVAISTGPYAYLTWASGLMSAMWEQARKRGFRNLDPERVKKPVTHSDLKDWESQFPPRDP